jgi:NAD-dependent SIR2 family protein deacetylase
MSGSYYIRQLKQVLGDVEGKHVGQDIKNIVILTGAGVSAESGIDTFRSAGGLWEQHKVEDVATPEAFARDPDLVLRFYDMRREHIQQVEPNAAHYALARLDAAWSGNLLLVTQNVDDLHERAGVQRLLHMHGEHLNAWCNACDARHKWRATLIDRPACPACGVAGQLRPDIVWFGECRIGWTKFTTHWITRICSSALVPLARSIRPLALCARRGKRAYKHWN